MKRSQKPPECETCPPVFPEPRAEATAVRLRIEKLEPRLTPQSSTSILD